MTIILIAIVASAAVLALLVLTLWQRQKISGLQYSLTTQGEQREASAPPSGSPS